MMMRRTLLGWVALAAGGLTPVAAQDTLRVGVAAEAVTEIYTEVRIPVWVDMRQVAGERLGSFTVRLTWADSVLLYRRVTPRAFNNIQVRTDSISYGIVRVAGINVAGVDSVRTLFDLVLDHWTGGGTSPIGIQPEEMSGIQPAFRDLLASTTVVTQPGTFCAATGRWGDLDGDGFANSRDGLAVLTNVVGLATPGFDQTKADVDNDGSGTTRDALILLSYAVGLDIPGHRVLLPIGGTCSQTPALSLAPDTVELVPDQSMRPTITTADAAGTIVSSGLNWRSLDPAVAVVDTGGTVTGVAPGTAHIVGSLGPGLQDTMVVTVIGRRTMWHVNSPVAAGAGLQLGTSQYPFDDIYMVMPWVSEGDTVLLAPGINLMDFNPNYTQSWFDVGVVVMGDTTGGQPRPLLRAPSTCCYSLYWQNGGSTEIRNIEFDGLYWAVEVDFLQHLVIDNVTVRKAPGTRYGFVVNRFVDTVEVSNSQLFGDTTSFNATDAIYVDAARLVQIRDVVIDGWTSAGIELYDADSSDVERVTITGPGYGVRGYTSVKPHLAYRIADSYIETNYDAAYLSNVRTMVSERNVYRTRSSLSSQIPLEVVGHNVTGGPPRVFRSVGDSIDYLGNYYWTYLSQLDSAFIDSLWFKHRVDSLTGVDQYLQSDYAELTNSELYALNLDGIYHRGRRLTVDNTVFEGCANACTWSNTVGIQSLSYNDSGPYLTVTNSSFFNMQYGIYSPTSNDSAGPSIITNNTIDSVQYGMWIDADSLYITDNVMTRVFSRAIEVDRSGPNKPTEFATIARNQIQCQNPSITGSYGILYYNTSGRLEDNKIVNCYYGVYASASTSTATGWNQEKLELVGDTIEQSGANVYGMYISGRWLASLYNNTVRNSPQYGIYFAHNLLAGDSATLVVDTNAVSGTGLAAIRYQPSDSLQFIARANNISNNLQDGLWISTSTPSVRFIRDGQFVGNARWAINSSYAVDAQANYWGDVLGPGGSLGNPQSLGDSVNNALIDASNFLTSPPANLPPLAPPAAGGSIVAADRTVVLVPPPTDLEVANDAFTPQAIRQQERDELQLEHERRRAALREELDLARAAERRDAEQRRQRRRQQLNERLFQQ